MWETIYKELLDGVQGAWSNKMEQSYWRRGNKLDQRPSGEHPRLRRDKVSCPLHDNTLEGDTNGLNQEMKLKRESMFWKPFWKGKVQGNVLFKGPIYFKLLEIALYVLGLWTPL